MRQDVATDRRVPGEHRGEAHPLTEAGLACYVPIPVARLPSEMPNHVSAEEPEASSGAIVEGRDIGRPVVADLWADLNLRADPMLPAGRDVNVTRGV